MLFIFFLSPEKLLSPSEMYVKAVLPLIQDGKVSRFCCVNDGLKQSVARLLGCSKAKQSTTTSTSPAPLTINLNANLWRSGALFNWAASEVRFFFPQSVLLINLLVSIQFDVRISVCVVDILKLDFN